MTRRAVAIAAVLLGATVMAATPVKAKRINNYSFSIAVPDTTYGGYTVAFLVPDDHEDYVNVQCFLPDLAGDFVYSTWWPVNGPEVVIGPIPEEGWYPSWPAGSAVCAASHGYFRRNGFGNWNELAFTYFNVILP